MRYSASAGPNLRAPIMTRYNLRAWHAALALISLVFSLAGTSFSQTTAPAYLVKDINPGTTSYPSQVESLANVGDSLFFSMDDSISGQELWRSDGTAAGTKRVSDIWPGVNSSEPSNIVDVNGIAFFTAVSEYHFLQVWRSDGTVSGTFPLTDFTHHAFYHPYVDWENEFVAINNTLFFTASDGVSGFQLWKSDGTVAGTKMLSESGVHVDAHALTNVQGTLFWGMWGGAGEGLWKSDTSATGMTLVKDELSILDITSVNGTVYLIADDQSNYNENYELWKSDGTAVGTVKVKDINGYEGSSFGDGSELINVNGTLYFMAFDSDHGFELWKSDGTEAGTLLVKDIAPGLASAELESLTAVNNKLFFTANDGLNGRELWQSNGTVAGTVMVKNINPGGHAFSGGGPYEKKRMLLTNVGGTVYFVADDGTHGYELWKSDGTAGGTVLVKELTSGTAGTVIGDLTSMQGRLFFASNGLWQSDGTSEGTVRIKHNSLSGSHADPAQLTRLGERSVFVAKDGIHGAELWQSDGIAAGTTLLKDINPGSSHSYPNILLVIDETLFFTAETSSNGRELWKSDGTAAGTVMVKDIKPGAGSSVDWWEGSTLLNGTLFFLANGNELWKSDGTEAGTVMVKVLLPGSQLNPEPSITNVNETIFFGTYLGHNAAGNEIGLWKSDGTASGTVLLKRFTQGVSITKPWGFTRINGQVLFIVDTLTHGLELWRTDGTEAGTVLVKDMYPGSASSDIWEFVSLNNRVFFVADDGTHGRELWRSDGTEAGTALVKDINPGHGYEGPIGLRVVGGALFFTANDRTHGFELWRSDGTAQGTLLFKDINPGALGSYPNVITHIQGTLLFSADDGTHGYELWKSNGTTQGTQLIHDVAPGIDPGGPTAAVMIGSQVLFSANDGAHGRELWTFSADGIGRGFLTYVPQAAK